MKDRILQLLREQDSFAAIEFAIAGVDAMTAITVLDELMRDLYWKEKDLAAAVTLGRAAAQHALTAAYSNASGNPELATQLREKAKALCYNIASFTWRGWGEAGIQTAPFEKTVGLDAARTNLRLAVELKKGDLPLSRAHWMLGALQMSQKEHAAAKDSFRKAAEFARLAAEHGEEILAVAFERLNEVFARGCGPSSAAGFAESLAELAKASNGEFYAKQFSKAVEIFCYEEQL